MKRLAAIVLLTSLLATFALAESITSTYGVAATNGMPSSATAGVASRQGSPLQGITVTVSVADGGTSLTPATCVARGWRYNSVMRVGDGGLGAWVRVPQLDTIMIADGGTEMGQSMSVNPPFDIPGRIYYSTSGCGADPHYVTLEGQY